MRTIFLSLFLLLLTFCNEKEKVESTESEQLQLEEKEIKKKEYLVRVQNLIDRYDVAPLEAASHEDDYRTIHTYHFQDLIEKTSRLFVYGFDLRDIVRTESGFTLVIELWTIQGRTIAELNCTTEQFDALDVKYQIRSIDVFEDHFVLMELSDVSRFDFKVVGRNSADDINSYADIELEPSDLFVFRGKLIDIIE